MANEQPTDHNAQPLTGGDNLRGGTQGGEAGRAVGVPKEGDEDTQDTTAPSGGVYPDRPAWDVPTPDRSSSGRGNASRD